MQNMGNNDHPDKPGDPGCGKCTYRWAGNFGWLLSVSLSCSQHSPGGEDDD